MSLPVEDPGLQILCDALGDGVVLFDGTDRVRFVSESATRLLGASRSQLMGLSSHNVFVGYLRTRPGAVARLRAGEPVVCDAADDSPAGLRARCLLLPAADPAASPVTALVLQDMRLANALRRVEDTLATVHRNRTPRRAADASPAHPLRHREIVRVLAREVRRSQRDGQELSVAMVRAPRAVSPRLVGDRLARTLRGQDRAGHLRARPRPEDGAADEVTAASLELPLDPRDHWFLLVLPSTSTTGAHALVMRLRAHLEGDGGLPELGFGVATLRQPPPADDRSADCARDLLERAAAACAAPAPAPGRRAPTATAAA